MQRLKTKVGDLLVPGNNDPWPEVRDTLNRSLRGWSNYFCHGTRRPAFRGVDHYVYERVRDFLARRHKVAGRGTRRFSCDVVYGERGLLRLERLPLDCPAVCLAVKPVGEPDAGDRHVRFDERGWETERCHMAQATAPILDSTKRLTRLHRRKPISLSSNADGMRPSCQGGRCRPTRTWRSAAWASRRPSRSGRGQSS